MKIDNQNRPQKRIDKMTSKRAKSLEVMTIQHLDYDTIENKRQSFNVYIYKNTFFKT